MADSGERVRPASTSGLRRRSAGLALGFVVVAVGIVVLIFGVGHPTVSVGQPVKPDSVALLREATTRLQASRSFQFRYDVDYGSALPSGNGLIIQSAHGAFMRPSSLQAQIALLTPQGPVSSQIVEVGHTSYLLNPLTSSWGRVTGSFDPASLFDPSRGLKRLVSMMSTVRIADSVEVAGRCAWHIEARVPGTAVSLLVGTNPQVATVPVDVWIDAATKTVTQVKVSGALSKDEPKGTSRMLALSGYGKVYTITAPAGGS